MKPYLAALPALVLAGAASSALALPVAKSMTDTPSMVEQVGHKECWFKHGERHCRWVSDEPVIYLQLGKNHHDHHDDHHGNDHHDNNKKH